MSSKDGWYGDPAGASGGPVQHHYAQTPLQLLRQFEREGRSEADRQRAAKAYHLAARLCSGQYRPSGKPNIEHLVGTASILCALEQPIDMVVAGLLHSVYAHGDFGAFRPGITERKRAVVREAAGIRAEAYVARYATLDWGPSAINGYLGGMDRLDALDRAVVVLRLADRLEDTLDGGDLYCANAEQRLRNLAQGGASMVNLASALGFPRLAAELGEALSFLSSARIPHGLQNGDGHTRVYLAMPNSCRMRYSALIARLVMRFIVRAEQVIRRRWRRRSVLTATH